jgi:hypothetical protein
VNLRAHQRGWLKSGVTLPIMSAVLIPVPESPDLPVQQVVPVPMRA